MYSEVPRFLHLCESIFENFPGKVEDICIHLKKKSSHKLISADWVLFYSYLTSFRFKFSNHVGSINSSLKINIIDEKKWSKNGS